MWLIVVGLLVIVAQVVVSIVAVIKGKAAQDSVSTQGFGQVIVDLLKGLMATIPLGVLGFLLILIGLIVGGQFSIGALFPTPETTP